MGNPQDQQGSKTQVKGGGRSQANQKGQGSKPETTAGQDQMQQRDSEHGSTRSFGNDQERARDSGEKSHE
jgi:hypothetical protein